MDSPATGFAGLNNLASQSRVGGVSNRVIARDPTVSHANPAVAGSSVIGSSAENNASAVALNHANYLSSLYYKHFL